MTAPWVPYNDQIEQTQPDEEAMIDEIVASMGRVNRRVFDQHRHGLRDAHAKSHGVLRGVLQVYDDLPEELAQGMFQSGRQYGVVARLSSAPGNLHTDKIRSLKGFAIKVIGVEGRKMLAGMEDELTQDFLMVNLPVLPFGNVKAYMEFQRSQEGRGEPGALAPELAHTAASALKAVGLHPSNLLAALGAPSTHILGETFHTMAALRFGRYVAKVSLAPRSPEVTALTGVEVDAGENDSVFRDLVVEFFAKHGAEYEIRAQLCTDLGVMPVEDCSVEWPAAVSPHRPLGKLVFGVQDAYSPVRRVYADDVLSFNPWHCLEAHQPLGSIMRSRRRAYEASAAFRHEMNAVPRREPRGMDEVVD